MNVLGQSNPGDRPSLKVDHPGSTVTESPKEKPKEKPPKDHLGKPEKPDRTPSNQRKGTDGGGGGNIGLPILATAVYSTKNVIKNLIQGSTTLVNRRKSFFNHVFNRTGGIAQRTKDLNEFRFSKDLGVSNGVRTRITKDGVKVMERISPKHGPTLEIIDTDGFSYKFRFNQIVVSPPVTEYVGQSSNLPAYQNARPSDKSIALEIQHNLYDRVKNSYYFKVNPINLIFNVAGKGIRFEILIKVDGQLLQFANNPFMDKVIFQMNEDKIDISRYFLIEIPYTALRNGTTKRQHQVQLIANLYDDSCDWPESVLIASGGNFGFFYDDQLLREVPQETYSSVEELRPVVTATSAGVVNNQTKYMYEIRLDGIDQIKDRVKKIVYKPDHPTFQNMDLSSENKNAGFVVSWRGWGCVNRVKAYVYFDNGDERTFSFNMCQLLSR
ncbi:pYEATS domain-containing protein [Spirosoma fluminis]